MEEKVRQDEMCKQLEAQLKEMEILNDDDPRVIGARVSWNLLGCGKRELSRMDEKFLSTPQKLMLVIGMFYETYKEWPGVSDIYNAMNRNTHTWYQWQDFLLENGLIEIKETKSRALSLKRQVILTEKGLKVYEALKDFLTKLDEVS